MSASGFDPEEYRSEISPWLTGAGQWETLQAFARAVVSFRDNLTAWRDRDLWEKGILASLKALEIRPEWQEGIDIGTGAGFPGLVLAIVRPGQNMTLIDSRTRRVQFLQDLISDLHLPWVSVYAARGEEFLQDGHRESFDMATIRAVGDMHLSLELALPALRVDGMALIWRGAAGRRETQEALPWLQSLGGTLDRAQPLRLSTGPFGFLVSVYKSSSSPSLYPRLGAKLGR